MQTPNYTVSSFYGQVGNTQSIRWGETSVMPLPVMVQLVQVVQVMTSSQRPAIISVTSCSVPLSLDGSYYALLCLLLIRVLGGVFWVPMWQCAEKLNIHRKGRSILSVTPAQTTSWSSTIRRKKWGTRSTHARWKMKDLIYSVTRFLNFFISLRQQPPRSDFYLSPTYRSSLGITQYIC